MKQTKYLLMALIALCFSISVNAQKTKMKNTTKTANVATTYQCPMKCEGDKTYKKNGKCPLCGMQMKPVKALTAQAKYQCPMNCEKGKTYTASGKCPVCNMNLKELASKKIEDGHEGHNH
jgi:Cu2+-exporting ATPase